MQYCETILKNSAKMRLHLNREFLNEVGISSSGSVRRALNSLVAARLIQPSRAGYRFGNPFFREWLKRGLNG